MSWNEADFLARLGIAVERFDREEAARLAGELIAALNEGARVAPQTARASLGLLRRKRFFALIERLAQALRQAGQDDAQIRRQYAQSLIDQDRAPAAIDVLEALVAATARDPAGAAENAEARGLLGRAYKQLYVDAVNPEPAAAALCIPRLNLGRAVEAYHAVYRSDPARHLWHGINTVALVCRARRDRVELASAPDPLALAGEILAAVEASAPRDNPTAGGAWDLATAAEACIALERNEDALLWIGRYVQRPEAEADAFELASTLRQLTEVWQLTVAAPPGSLILPLLQSSLLQRKGGRVDLATGELSETLHRSEQLAGDRKQLEKILGSEGVVTFGWYQTGLERCRTVAQVRTLLGEGIGTGFLVRGGDFSPGLEGSLLVLTNAHVVSADPRVQAAVQALDPADAQIVFEALPSTAGQSFRVARQVWSSPPEELDATLLALDPPPPATDCFPLAPRLPVADGKQKVYVIGHPGGRSLSLSLHDNLLLDHDGTRLLHYRAPTEGGSSGSPVFNQLWNMIGLHHAGGVEMPRLNGQPGTYAANEGIWIQRILEETRAAGLSLGGS